MRKLNTQDVFCLVRLIDEAGIKNALKDELSALMDGKKVVIDAENNGMDIVFALISAFGKKGAEQAFYEFLSGPFEMSVKEIENLPPQETLKMIRELANLEEWKSFFNSAVRSGIITK